MDSIGKLTLALDAFLKEFLCSCLGMECGYVVITDEANLFFFEF